MQGFPKPEAFRLAAETSRVSQRQHVFTVPRDDLSSAGRESGIPPNLDSLSVPHGADAPPNGAGEFCPMSKSPAFQWYPKDILASARVQELSLAEEGAYRRLIDFCWLNGSIPADPERCARLIGKGASICIASAVQTLFTPHPNDPTKLIHDRLEIEREKQREHSEKRKTAAEARWSKMGKPADARGKQSKSRSVNGLAQDTVGSPPFDSISNGDASAYANALQVQCSSSASSSSSPHEVIRETTHENSPRASDAVIRLFGEFFSQSLSIFQQEQLAVVEDLTAWRATLTEWKTNGYSHRNIAGMIRLYRETLVRPQGGIANGKSKLSAGAVALAEYLSAE